MGFVYRLSCPACGFHRDHVGFGLGAGCAVTHALAQDNATGRLREFCVERSDLIRHTGTEDFGSEQEWVSALGSCIDTMLTPNESAVTPHQAVCPTCRGKLIVEDQGIM